MVADQRADGRDARAPLLVRPLAVAGVALWRELPSTPPSTRRQATRPSGAQSRSRPLAAGRAAPACRNPSRSSSPLDPGRIEALYGRGAAGGGPTAGLTSGRLAPALSAAGCKFSAYGWPGGRVGKPS
jgi:hypothetical protein